MVGYPRAEKSFRTVLIREMVELSVANEVPTVLMIVIVIAVVVRPF